MTPTTPLSGGCCATSAFKQWSPMTTDKSTSTTTCCPWNSTFGANTQAFTEERHACYLFGQSRAALPKERGCGYYSIGESSRTDLLICASRQPTSPATYWARC